ncbi:neuronal acetylcholine receptor subunit alpha-7-like [Saccostrea echinata]|uniref:neuronal acetylcholine receptor subunit alpha-7-like n=1 Tax=Saccostrea echinata TaxID=191078 RepID=UPI002A829893|nr:neuronal acetylcholine receptor subunit alpha-7-like [Saccostrea echinata]
MVIFLFFCFLFFTAHCCVCSSSDDIVNLHDSLFKNYRNSVRPVRNQHDAVHVNISFNIIMIHDLDLKNQVLTTNAWLRIAWTDEFLTWNATDFNNVTEILVSRGEVWTPDLLVENTAFGYRELGIEKMLLNLDNKGQIIWEPGLITQTICEVNIAKYPFDSQHCSIRVMSWMHTNRSLQVSVARDFIDTTNYYPNGEWDLVHTRVKAFSPEDGSYNVGEILPGAEAIIELRRRPVYYIISTILPISMLSLLNVLVFMLPTNTGEKMTLAVTVLLSFTVFMSVVNEVMPKTSNSVSILAVYLTILLTMSGLSVASTVLVLHFHHHADMNSSPNRMRNSRVYDVQRANSINNNRCRKSSSMRKGNTRPSSEKLLEDYMEVDDSGDQSSTEVNVCCRKLRLKLESWRRRRKRRTLGRQFAEKLDRALFCTVTVLTIASTVVVMVLLIYW